MGLAPDLLRNQVMLGTSCGLAGWSLRDVGPQLKQLQQTSELINEQLER